MSIGLPAQWHSSMVTLAAPLLIAQLMLELSIFSSKISRDELTAISKMQIYMST